MRGCQFSHSHVRKCPQGADNNARAFSHPPPTQCAPACGSNKVISTMIALPLHIGKQIHQAAEEAQRTRPSPRLLLPGVPLNARDKHAFRFINQTQQKATATGRMTVEMWGKKLQRTSGKRKRNYQRANKMLSRVRRSFKFSSGDK